MCGYKELMGKFKYVFLSDSQHPRTYATECHFIFGFTDFDNNDSVIINHLLLIFKWYI